MTLTGSDVISTQSRAIHTRLPQELISSIFTLFHEEGGPQSHNLLLLVCREWQRICYSTPALWREVGVSVGPWRRQRTISTAQAGMGSPLAEIINWAKARLLRSGGLPCSLRIRAHPSEFDYLSGDTPFFRDIITSVSPRLSKLVMSTYAAEVEHLNALLPDGLPELNELALDLIAMREIDAIAFDNAGFSRCQKLRVVEIDFHEDNTRVLSFNPITFLPWDQLSTLCYKDREVTLADFTKVFSLCTRLETCSLRLCFYQEVTPLPDVPPTVLPTLRTLSLTFSGFHIASFLQPFSMPALTELDLSGERPFEDESFSLPLLELHRRHPFPLRSLSLAFITLEMDDFLGFLSRLEYLEEFSVDGCNCLDKPLVQRLTVEPGVPNPFLPRLMRLDIQEYCSDSDEAVSTNEDIIQMVKSRVSHQASAAGVARIKSVLIVDEITLEADENLYEEFHAIAEEGLNLSLRGFRFRHPDASEETETG